MEFTFERSDWDLTLDTLRAGQTLSAARCLTLLEPMSEEEADTALLALEEREIGLDVSDLPRDGSVGEAAVRLRQEHTLAQSGRLMTGLEENDPLQLYLQELSAMPMAGDPVLLANRYVAGDDTAAEKLVSLSLGLVVERACRMTGHGVLLLDLIQEGNLGLWQGVLNYTDGNFDTHIRWWIDHYLHKAVVLQAHSRGAGQKLRQGMEDYRDADQRLLGELGRNATLEEIAETIHVTPEEAATLAAMLEQAKLRQQVDRLKEPAAPTPEDEQAVESTAYFQIRQRILEMLSTLNQQEAKVLTLRFGLEDNLPLSPEQTGKIMGLTPDEVIAIETAALAKLRQQGQ